MSAAVVSESQEKSKLPPAILIGGLIAGVIDIAAAFVTSGLKGRTPLWVLQSVAGGLLGPNTFQGGLRTAALGLLIHFLIATSWAAVYYAASVKLPILCARARVDYDTLLAKVNGQFLFGWTPNPGTAVYAGYNDNLNWKGFNPFSGHYEPGLQRNERTFFIKMSYLFRRSI